MKHYLITYHPTTGEVTNVRNRKHGDVQFKAIRIDESAGLASNSVVKLWTHHNGKVFNIVHMHVNDTSDEVPIDVQYLDSWAYDIENIPFGTDVTGAKLRYKFLVYDFKIRDVLYNSGKVIESIKFEEHPIATEAFL